jgi:hypothetical protein
MHVTARGATSTLAEHQQQCLVRENVDEPWYAAAGAVQRAQRTRIE